MSITVSHCETASLREKRAEMADYRPRGLTGSGHNAPVTEGDTHEMRDRTRAV